MGEYYAHSGPTRSEDPSDRRGWQLLRDHLRGVARLARRFAEEARPGDVAFSQGAQVAGLLHDLGKYRREFQDLLRGLRCKGESTRHKQFGAAHAAALRRIDLAFAILGHHGGLPNHADLAESVTGARELLPSLWSIAVSDCPEVSTPISEWEKSVSRLGADLSIRLLFSCLVDADWLDTSAHEAACTGRLSWQAPPDLDAAGLLARVRAYIDGKAATCRDARIAAIRAEVLEAAIHAAGQAIGLFTMTVPTGGGKTLSSLAFALEHAQRHALRRIIYVAPYLSIIEQNARVFREALGDVSEELILEHHSMAEPRSTSRDEKDGAESEAAQRLAENWESPVVLTTSVQFYETLFSNEPGRCRKLHSMARSVVILDECQTLPPGLTAPTCQMLQQVSEYLGCSMILCTATQPAWKKDPRLLPEGLDGVREIVPASLDLFTRLKRVRVTWLKPDAEPMTWAAVAAKMLDRPRVLCVVNTKKAARELYAELHRAGADSVFHLSTSMCPAHRLQVLDRVRALLGEGRPCHLVSTQLIEAGVDVDFPLLLREIAPLEAIVQAAGRCNREGLLNQGDGHPGGEVVVFRTMEAKLPPDAWYRNGTAVVEQDFLRNRREPDIHSPADLAEYYRRLYPTGNLDQKQIVGLRKKLCFADVGKEYRLIDEATTALVVMRWSAARDAVESLLSEIRTSRSRGAYRRLQRYSVNVYEHELRQLAGSVVMDHLPGINLCSLLYSEAMGLVPGANAGSMVV